MTKKDKKHGGELVVKHSHRDTGLSEQGCQSSPFSLPYFQTFREIPTKTLKQSEERKWKGSISYMGPWNIIETDICPFLILPDLTGSLSLSFQGQTYLIVQYIFSELAKEWHHEHCQQWERKSFKVYESHFRYSHIAVHVK